MNTNKTQAEQLPQDAVMQTVLKASDLRIGNYVTCGKENHIVSHVNNDDTIRVCKDKESERYFSFYNLDVFKPIPLTEDLLGKFGFEIDYVWCDFTKNLPNDRMLGFDLKNNHIFLGQWTKVGETNKTKLNFRDTFLTKCNYAHELQNLYFALTGSELTVA